MALHSTNHAQLQLEHLKQKEAGLLSKLSLLKTQKSSGDHDIEGATRRAQYQLADLQREIATFGPSAPPIAPPVEKVDVLIAPARTSKKP